MRIIWYNNTTSPGTYGDWTQNLAATQRELRWQFRDQKGADAIAAEYVAVDLDALDELEQDEWERLLAQWRIADCQRWTTFGENVLMLEEQDRRRRLDEEDEAE